MAELLIQLEPDKFYHIYNHAVGKENFFERDTDYRWFLSKFKKYIVPVSDVYSFCLMPNHFHLIVKIKSEEVIKETFKEKITGSLSLDELMKQNKTYLLELISKQYSNLFNAYAKYFNFIHHRKGTLFTRAFRRKHIADENYLRQLICYLHQNPVEAGFCDQPSNWRYSSYNAITSVSASLVCRNEVISLFDRLENFIYCNSKKIEMEIDKTSEL